MARLTLIHPKSTERHDVTVSEPITERTMVQAGAVMTTQKRKELTYVPRLENPNSLAGHYQVTTPLIHPGYLTLTRLIARRSYCPNRQQLGK